ncbi:unnamed protein product [Didymodactylos carnosus]|uniref:Uncharacterized protein n=1 Tax=Didymodactylos carnosus TaxID=1234261 RepID=A0A8S2STE6_9BILA|nr:unnamed protein product [Didymodactylos carnosus]CAF4240922.1 unnamed protein product [Didymodactylos carnosus]
MILVGCVKDKEHLEMLQAMVNSREPKTGEKKEAAASISVMECEEVEFILEHMTLKHNTEDLNDARTEHLVYEDNFNPALFDLVEESASFKKLRKICRNYEEKPKVNVDNVMAEHDARVAKTSPFFLKKGLSKDESQASAFAISFYTGTKSEACNRGASLVARRSNGVVVEVKVIEELNKAAIILYYLVKALSYIPYYWGYVTRCCDLKDGELKLYSGGALITWIQFSSSKKGKEQV